MCGMNEKRQSDFRDKPAQNRTGISSFCSEKGTECSPHAMSKVSTVFALHS